MARLASRLMCLSDGLAVDLPVSCDGLLPSRNACGHRLRGLEVNNLADQLTDWRQPTSQTMAASHPWSIRNKV